MPADKYPLIKFDSRSHTLQCMYCYERISLRPSTVANAERLLLVKEAYEDQHDGCRHELYGDVRTVQELRAWWQRSFAQPAVN